MVGEAQRVRDEQLQKLFDGLPGGYRVVLDDNGEPEKLTWAEESSPT